MLNDIFCGVLGHENGNICIVTQSHIGRYDHTTFLCLANWYCLLVYHCTRDQVSELAKTTLPGY